MTHHGDFGPALDQVRARLVLFLNMSAVFGTVDAGILTEYRILVLEWKGVPYRDSRHALQLDPSQLRSNVHHL